MTVMTQGWQQFKMFVFTYYTLLIHAKDFYEKESVNAKQRENYSYPNVLPVPAKALTIFTQLILTRYRARLERTTSQLLAVERERESPQDPNLRTLLSIFWSCSLTELGRISISRGNITFWKEKNRQITHIFKEAYRNEEHFREKILVTLECNSSVHYTQLYQNNLQHLHAFELTQHLDSLCSREEKLAEHHLPSDEAVEHYLGVVLGAILEDIEGILNKERGFKYILLNCAEHTEELLPHAVLYFSLFQRLQDKAIPLACRLVAEAIQEKGIEIFSKQVRPREQITHFLKFKRTVRLMFESSSIHNLDIEQTMEKRFKRLL